MSSVVIQKLTHRATLELAANSDHGRLGSPALDISRNRTWHRVTLQTSVALQQGSRGTALCDFFFFNFTVNIALQANMAMTKFFLKQSMKYSTCSHA